MIVPGADPEFCQAKAPVQHRLNKAGDSILANSREKHKTKSQIKPEERP